MPHFGIAHLSFRQADVKRRRLDMGVGEILDEAAPSRCRCLAYGVVGAFGAFAPTVEHTQHDGAGMGGLGA